MVYFTWKDSREASVRVCVCVSLQVQAVPTVIAMKDGKVVDRFVGLKDEADLESFVQKLMG